MFNVTIAEDGQVIALTSPEQMLRFHAIWLRDNSHDPETRSAGNGQRLIALRDISAQTRVSAADINGQTLRLSFEPEGKTLDYNLNWLIDHAYDAKTDRGIGWLPSNCETWGATLASIPTQPLSCLQNNRDALQSWLGGVLRYGFGKITDGPVTSGALFQVVDLFGFVRETNYGRNFEVRTEVNPSNLAYTGLGLQAHTDNPYRDPVPTLQILYCLESSAKGGENMVVDGFAAAQRLRDENAEYFDVLSSYCAKFEYAGEQGVRLTTRRPIIELAPDGELIGVRFNNRSLSAVTDVPFGKMQIWYDAYRRLGEIIDDPAMEVTFRLNPGESFIVDNTRVLHARKGYSGEGTRWLQGCYADKDGLRSTYFGMVGQSA